MNRNKLIISADRDRSCNVLQVAEHAGQGCACISLSDNPSRFSVSSAQRIRRIVSIFTFSLCISQPSPEIGAAKLNLALVLREIDSQNTVLGILCSIALIIIARFERTFRSRRAATLIADRYLCCTL